MIWGSIRQNSTPKDPYKEALKGTPIDPLEEPLKVSPPPPYLLGSFGCYELALRSSAFGGLLFFRTSRVYRKPEKVGDRIKDN